MIYLCHSAGRRSPSPRNHICQKSRSSSGRDGAGIMLNFTFRGKIKGLMLAFLARSGFIPPPVKPWEGATGEGRMPACVEQMNAQERNRNYWEQTYRP